MSLERQFLPKKFPDLHKEKEVEQAVVRENQHRKVLAESETANPAETRKIPNNPEAKVEAYLHRLENLFQHPDEKTRERNLSLIKPALYEAFVIKPEDVPDSYFELQKRIARERGQTVEDIPEPVRQKMIETIIEDQKQQLDRWVDYLTSSDAGYPTWYKYFAFRNVTKLSQFDKEHGHFKKRSKDTVAPIPDIYREALAVVADKLQAAAQTNPEILKTLDTRRTKAEETGEDLELTEEEQKLPFKSFEEFEQYAKGKFPDLYAKEISQALEKSMESREGVAGEWKKYTQEGSTETIEYFDAYEDDYVEVDIHTKDKNKDVKETQAYKLHETLEGQGTGWCTAGLSTAEDQLSMGDFYVYYSYDKTGKPTVPRLAIRMYGDDIAEVRGVLPNQEVEPQLQEVLDAKLNEFGSTADSFKKKSADMQLLTAIEKKVDEGADISKDDLKFLYEIDSKIESFGYEKDPRIKEILAKRDSAEDLKRIFGVLDKSLADDLALKGEADIVIHALNEFDFPVNEKAIFVINWKHLRSLKDLGSYPELSDLEFNQDFAQLLIKGSSYYKLADSLDCFKGLSIEIIDEFRHKMPSNSRSDLRAREQELLEKVIKNKDSFENFSFDDIARMFTQDDTSNLVFEEEEYDYDDGKPGLPSAAYLFPKDSLSKELADEWIQHGDYHSLIKLHRAFPKSVFNQSLAFKIARAPSGQTVELLFEDNAFDRAIFDSNLARILLKFNPYELTLHLDHFEGITDDVAFEIIKERPVDVARGLKHFSNLSELSALNLMQAGFAKVVLDNLEQFRPLSNQAFQLIHERAYQQRRK